MDEPITLQEENLPNNLFILPLASRPLFPGLFAPLVILEKEDVEIINQALSHGGLIGTLMTIGDGANKTEDNKKPEDTYYHVGTVCRILKSIKLPDGGMNVFVSTIKRFKVQQFFANGAYLVAGVEYLNDIEDDSEKLKAWTRSLAAELKNRQKDGGMFNEETRLNMVNIEQPSRFADYMASVLQIAKEESQHILETLNVKDRIEMVLYYIQKERKITQMQTQIQDRVNKKLEKTQRDYFLREEMRAIQKELGGNYDSSLEKLRTQIQGLGLTGEAKESVMNDMGRLVSLDPSSPDYSVLRGYLETVAALPWADPKAENYSLENARKILERDHYGMKDVKDRILEFLAVRKKKQDTKGAIICLVGPPGVGKTSVGISIAHALGKDYFRFSVGGMRDESEIKGHRRTYIGAMPGKIIQGLKAVKSKDPVFLIDEIDKMGESYQGDPASALLEVLDPEQNISFRDRYLDIPFDVSHVLFIVTANTLETIPAPLLDRMEIIELSGYTSQEKLNIGKKYLVPKSLAKHGLTKAEIHYTPQILHTVAEEYAREAGVRNFEKSLDKINRKVALEIEEHPDTKLPIRINAELLKKYLGQPIFVEDEILRADKVGTAVGLAWTSMGGDTLLIEAENYPGKGELKITGQLGAVMQESVNIAMTYLKREAERRGIDKSWFEENNVHLHVPEGATPKDGPSAGITITCALYSLLTGQVIEPNLAMTGELTLTGKVMPIGGLKEKVLAARRNKINTILIPQFNKRDLDKLEAEVTEGITFHLVDDMQKVLAFAFPSDKSVRMDEEAYQRVLKERKCKEKTEKEENEGKMATLIAAAVAKALEK